MSAPRLALTHAGGLLAEGIIEALVESGIAPDSVVLLDGPEQEGASIPFGGTHLRIQNQHDYDYEGLDAILLLQPDEELFDLLQHADCYLLSHTVSESATPCYFFDGAESVVPPPKPAVVELADAGLSTLLGVVKPLTALAPLNRVSVVNVLSAGMFGKAGVDELASQTIALLNGRDAEKSLFPLQLAFNMSPLQTNPRRAEQLAQLLGNAAIACDVQEILVAAFHGLAISVSLEFDEDVSLEAVRACLGQLREVDLASQPVSPLTHCREGKNIQVFELARTQKDAKRLQFWIIADSIRNGLVKNYLNAIQVLPNSFL